MNKFKLLVTGFLTVILGSTVAVGATHSKNIDPQETLAADTVRLYLDLKSFTSFAADNASFKVHTWNSSKGDQYFVAKKADTYYWYCDVDLATYSNGGGYRFTRYNYDGNKEWNKGPWCSYSSTSTNDYCKITGWTETGNWSKPISKTWKIKGGNSADGWNTDKIEIEFNDIVFNSSGLQVCAENVYLKKGQSIKITDGTNWLGYNSFETGTGSAVTSKFFTGEGDKNVEINNTGYYDFYFKVLTNKIWAQENSNASAKHWAESLLTNLECDGGKTAPSTVVWNELKTSFENLTVGAKTALESATANEKGTDIEKAIARYDFIVLKYGSTKYNDFIGRHSSSGVSNLLILSDISNNSNIVLLITVISTLSIAAIVLLAIKRKQTSK